MQLLNAQHVKQLPTAAADMLTKLTVRNFKSLLDVSVEFPCLAVLFGPCRNRCGGRPRRL